MEPPSILVGRKGRYGRRDTRLVKNTRIYLPTGDGRLAKVGWRHLRLEPWHILREISRDGLGLVALEIAHGNAPNLHHWNAHPCRARLPYLLCNECVQEHRVKRRATTVQWPEPVDQRLDHLCLLARQAGERVSRAEILGALVAHAPMDGEGLGVMLRAYRRMGQEHLVPTSAHPEDVSRLGRPRALKP